MEVDTTNQSTEYINSSERVRYPEKTNGKQREAKDGQGSSSSSSSSSDASSSGKKTKKKREKEGFVKPLEVEEEVDKEMIQFAIDEGINVEQFLQGRMSLRTCQVMSESKLKHRTCK
jgi:hypothetical protein